MDRSNGGMAASKKTEEPEIVVTNAWIKRVIARMKELEMDRKTLARSVGCSPALITQILTGKVKTTRLGASIHRALGWPTPGEAIAEREATRSAEIATASAAAKKTLGWLENDSSDELPPELDLARMSEGERLWVLRAASASVSNANEDCRGALEELNERRRDLAKAEDAVDSAKQAVLVHERVRSLRQLKQSEIAKQLERQPVKLRQAGVSPKPVDD